MQCVVPDCNHSSTSAASQGITFFPFPEEPAQRAAWLAAVACADPAAGAAVCSMHFLAGDMDAPGGARALRPGAVPLVKIQVKPESDMEEKPDESSVDQKISQDKSEFNVVYIKQEKFDVDDDTYVAPAVNEIDLGTVKVEVVREDDSGPSSSSETNEATADSNNGETAGMVFIPQHIKVEASVPCLAEVTVKVECDESDTEKENPVSQDQVLDGDEESGSEKAGPSAAALGEDYASAAHPSSPEEPDAEGVSPKVVDRTLPRKKKKKKDDKKSHKHKSLTKDKDVTKSCELCSKTFTKLSNLQKHIKMHSGEKPHACKICKKQFFYPSYLRNHMKVHSDEKPYTCDVCLKTFARVSNLRKHRKIHSTEKPYKCEVCSRAFSQMNYLHKHSKIHLEERPFVCEVCFKTFTCTAHLCKHMKIHTKGRPYVCNVCDKAFTDKNYFGKHMSLHSGEYPYSCDMCDKSFIQRGSLISHLRIHTGEKPFTCETCSKSFVQRSNYMSHLKTHSGEKPFVCTVCFKEFTRMSNLTTHRKKHTGEKPFTCDICRKSFGYKSCLQNHLRTHSGERPFKCHICSKTFIQKSNLQIHIRTHADDIPYHLVEAVIENVKE